MSKNYKWKVILIVIVVALAFWKAYPPFDTHDKQGSVTEKGKINLGLDLRGGMHIVLQVDTKGLTPEEAKDAPDRALEIIRNRIDQFGVLEPGIQRQGKDNIIVQLPGVTDRDRAIEIVGKTAHLEFKLVSDDTELIKKALAGEEVPGYELKYVKHEKREEEPLLVKKEAALTGDMLVDATTEFSQQAFNQPYVSLTFDNKGGAIFAALTGENVGKRLAIVLDGGVYSAPVIRERIPSGRAQITGNFSTEEANDMAIVLRAGALPAPVEVIEERIVGPTLGKDSIRQGLNAIIVGAIIVFCFMAGYYLLAGLIADFALFLNLILIMGALAYFHGTLTLPGIAGLVLTIGMAVDANVLIYERIREESNLGKSLRAAIQTGFDRAFVTIFDSNLTTLIAAVILFQFGTGPVRGFATTLSIGIVTSMFTAIVVTQTCLALLTSGDSAISKLSMLSVIKKTNIDFIGKRKFAYVFSGVIIVLGLISFYKRGEANYSIDFTGGTVQQLKFEKTVNIDDVRKALKDMGLGSASIQHMGANNQEILIRSGEMDPSKIINKFNDVFKDNKFEILRAEKVGPSVGRNLRGQAIKAVAIAWLFMLIYMALRFEFKFAVAGIIALVHDVLVSIAFLCFTNREISTVIIAALLTIIGYSINDTIVIFDRIRENKKIMRKASYNEIINTSINQTLGRTIFTSFTTIMVVTALYLFGGEVINDFAYILLVGFIFGCYSTVFIASPILVDWPSKKARQ